MRGLIVCLTLVTLLGIRPAFAVMEDYPSVKLQGLDKSVGRTVTFEAKVGSTIQYGPLFVKIHACRKAPPIEKPESASFLQIWEIPPGEKKSEWVFSGWMFASSPALSAMDHPVYDVWVVDCIGREEPAEDMPSEESAEEAIENTTIVQPQSQEIVDSEAEDQTPSSQTQGTQAVVAEEASSQDTNAQDAQQDVSPTPVVSNAPTPEEDAGFTAYDLMKNQQNKQDTPSPESGAQQTPIY